MWPSISHRDARVLAFRLGRFRSDDALGREHSEKGILQAGSVHLATDPQRPKPTPTGPCQAWRSSDGLSARPILDTTSTQGTSDKGSNLTAALAAGTKATECLQPAVGAWAGRRQASVCAARLSRRPKSRGR